MQLKRQVRFIRFSRPAGFYGPESLDAPRWMADRELRATLQRRAKITAARSPMIRRDPLSSAPCHSHRARPGEPAEPSVMSVLETGSHKAVPGSQTETTQSIF